MKQSLAVFIVICNDEMTRYNPNSNVMVIAVASQDVCKDLLFYSDSVLYLNSRQFCLTSICFTEISRSSLKVRLLSVGDYYDYKISEMILNYSLHFEKMVSL